MIYVLAVLPILGYADEGMVDLSKLPKPVCEVILTEQVTTVNQWINDGYTREQTVQHFKTKYYTRYYTDFFWNYAEQVYDLTVEATTHDVDPAKWVNETICSKLERSMYSF
jgi:hypothetical protein